MHRFHRLSIASATLVALAIAPGASAQTIDPAELAAILGKIDMSAVVVPAATDIQPFDHLARLHPGDAGPAMTGETFTFASSTPNGVRAESPNWTYEWRPDRAGVLLQLREGMTVDDPVPGGVAGIEQDARERLSKLGIPANEIGSVVARKLMKQTRPRDGGDSSPPALHGFKVFVTRSIGGVEVLGSRAVLSYGADHSFRKLLLYWPGLDGACEVPSVPHTPQQIAESIARDLVQTHEDDVAHRVSVASGFALTEPDDAGHCVSYRMQAALLDAPSSGENDPSDERIRVRRHDPDRVGAAFCDVETSEAEYDFAEQIQITQLRFANHTGAPLPARLRFQIRLPFGTTVNALDLQLTLPAGLDANLAASSIGLFTVGDQHPALLGGYDVRCQLEDPVTGAPIATDTASFQVEISGQPEEVD